MAQRTSVTIEIARAPWFLEAGLIEPAPSLERWKRKLDHLIKVTHPGTAVGFIVSDDVSREQEYRVVYDTSGDRAGSFTLGASVWAMAHDLTMGNSWCVYRRVPASTPVPIAPDPLRDDLDTAMERIRREQEEWEEQEYR